MNIWDIPLKAICDENRDSAPFSDYTKFLTLSAVCEITKSDKFCKSS